MNKKDISWKEVRLLWRQFDPIGVYTPDFDWPEDEYDDYVTETQQLLRENADYHTLLT